MRRISLDALNTARYALGHRVTRSTATVTFSQASTVPDQAPVGEATALPKPTMPLHRLSSKSWDAGSRQQALRYGIMGPGVQHPRVQVPQVSTVHRDGAGGGTGPRGQSRSPSHFSLVHCAAVGTLALLSDDAPTVECKGIDTYHGHSRDTSLPLPVYGAGALDARGHYPSVSMEKDTWSEEAGTMWFWSGGEGYRGHKRRCPGRSCGTRLQKHGHEDETGGGGGDVIADNCTRQDEDGRLWLSNVFHPADGTERHHHHGLLLRGETFHTAHGTLYLRRGPSPSHRTSHCLFPATSACGDLEEESEEGGLQGQAGSGTGTTAQAEGQGEEEEGMSQEKSLEPAYFVSTAGLRYVFTDPVHLVPGGEDVDLEALVAVGELAKVTDTQVLHAVPMPAWARGG